MGTLIPCLSASPRAGADLDFVAVRYGHREAGGDRPALARLEDHVLGGEHVHPRRALGGVGGQLQPRKMGQALDHHRNRFSVATPGTIDHSLTFNITTPLYAGSAVSDIQLSFLFGTFKNITGLSAQIFNSSNTLYATFVQNGDADHLILPPSSYFAVDSYTLKVGGLSTGSNGGFYSVAAVTAIPEPGTWALLLVGLGLVGLRLRQKAATLSQNIAA